jgi:2-polyprenyl-6-methoxyphenol hydroxylase-like FAD-dependent oxidoreductase
MSGTAARAVVIGGGMAGVLAAVALSRFAEEVTVVESDTFPDSPRPRRGLPQGGQNHMLMAGGAEAIDQLMPGTTQLLYAAGAHRLPMGGKLLTLSSEGWFRRFDDDSYVVACSRQLLDHIVRGQALRDPAITVVQGTKVLGLTGDARRVTGVRVEQDGELDTIAADFVVDAAGSRSRIRDWLVELGLPEVPEEYVDAGLAYSGRIYEAPGKAVDDFPGVLIQAEPGTGRPGTGGAFMPQEDGRWIVSLIGTGGAHPPVEEDAFLRFARELRDPVIADLISLARPLTPIRGSHGLANRRRRFETLPLPEGLTVIGDSAMVLSPNYATGMSLAALAALALRTELKRTGITSGLGVRVQRRVAQLGAGPWKMASGTDLFFPGVRTNITVRGGGMQQRMAARFSRTAAENPQVLKAVYEVTSLRAPQSRMMTPAVLGAVLRGPRQRPLTSRQAVGQFPEIGELLSGTETVR